MVDRFRKLLGLPREQLWVFIDAWYLLLKWDLLISAVPYARWRGQVATQYPAPNGNPVPGLPAINTLINISEKAARNHVRKMNCLRRCLCQQQLLAKRQIASQIHFGVALDEGNVTAHCWLTCEGVIINDSADVVERYTELTRTQEQSIEAMLLKP